MGGGDGTMRERKKEEEAEENEKGDKNTRVLGCVGSDCASGGIPSRPRRHSPYRTCW